MSLAAAQQASRERALLAAAHAADQPRTRFLAALRRARDGGVALPLAIDLGDEAQCRPFALGGWAAGAGMAWARGPLAQLLIVPADLPVPDLVLMLEIAGVALSPRRPVLTVTADVNSVAAAPWVFEEGQPWQPRRTLLAPAAALAGLTALLLTFRLAGAGAAEEPGQPGLALGRIWVRPARPDGGGA